MNIIDLNSILESFLNPPEPETFVKKLRSREVRKHELVEKMNKGHWIKDGLKTQFWQEILRPKIIKSLKQGMGTLLRPSSLQMSETQIKQILADMQANIGHIADLKYIVENGDDAAEKLSRMEK